MALFMVAGLTGLTALTGCDAGELLPLVDDHGALAGSYDPATGALAVAFDGAAVDTPSERAILIDGEAALERPLVPGDELAVLDDVGAPTAWFTVAEADLGLTEDDASSRYAWCYN